MILLGCHIVSMYLIYLGPSSRDFSINNTVVKTLDFGEHNDEMS